MSSKRVNNGAVMEAIGRAGRNNSFLGLAQSSNHINKGVHVFAAPAFLAISRAAWIKLGKPSLKPTPRGDVAEELSWCAEDRRFADNVNLFAKMCQQIRSETFSTTRYQSCTS